MDLNPSNEIKFISDDIKYKSEPLALPPLQVAAKNKSSFFDLANKVSSSEINLQDFSNVKFGDVYAQLEDDTYVAKYDTFLTAGGNQEEFQAQQQTGGEQLSNGLLKAGATALSGVASGTVGAVYGLIDFARTGNFSSVYDNSFTKVLDGWNEKLRYQLPNYYTEAEKKMDIGDKVIGGGANFWANDVAGGLGFTVGAIGSELVWDYVTGGAALATSASRLGAKASRILGREKSTLGAIDDVTQAVNRGKNFYKEPIINAGSTKFQNITVPTRLATGLGKTGEFANTVRFAYTSAGNEAGFEARHYMREMEDNFYETFKAQNNGQMPTYEEEQEFRGNLLNSANALYAFNSAVVGVSNVANVGRLFNIKSPLTAPSKWTNAKLFGIGTQKVEGELTAMVASKGQKVAQKVWGLGRSPIIEGVWEEGIQSVGKNTAKNWLEAGYNPTLTKETYNLGQASIDAFAQTYGTKEGWNEVGIGMIVGLLTGTGVNIATRQSIFTEAREEAANLENFSKFYSPKKMSENILYANRTQQDAQNAENAEVRGDFTSAELARKSAVISQLNFGYNLDYLNETVKDTTIAIDNIDDESIMKEYGVDADGANEIREKLKSEYVTTAKDYKKYRDFSEYFVGQSLKKEGLDGLETSNLKQAIAYELTLGSEAYKFSSEILESLKSKIASGYVNSEITTAMDVDNILLTASRESQIEFDNKVAELKQTTNKKEQLEQDRNNLMKVLLDESQEQKVARLQRLNNVEVELQELETERTRIESEVNATLAAASLNNPYRTEPSEQYLTTEQIENLDSNLNKVSELANSYKGADPQKALEIQKLRQEYARSLTAFKRYADLSRQLSDPMLGLRGKRNLVAEVRSEKTPNEITVETLNGLLGTREQLKVEGAERILNSSESVQDVIRDSAKMEVRQPENLQPEITPQREEPLDTVKRIIKENPYLLNYRGLETPKIPSEAELSEYYDLATRALNTPNFDAETIGMSGQLQVFSNDNNLTEDEIERLRELNQLMSDWQLYGGALNSENLSINDIIEQQIILDQEGVEEVEAEVTESELAEMSDQNPKEVEGDEIRAENIGQTYSRVFVRNTKYGYMISNLGIQKFLDGLDIADEVAVTINGNTTTVNRNGLSQYSSVGHKFNVEFRDGTQADISVEAGGVLKVEDFNKIRENSLYKVDRYILGKQSGYSLLYLGDTQVESDFSRIDDTMSYTDTEFYNLQANSDVIGFQVNLDDPYNKEELSKRKTKKNIEELTANIKIYMVDNQGNILGDLKANRDTGNSPEFLTLRAEAVRMALEKGAKGTLTLPYQAPLKHLFLGAPNFEFEGDGYKAYDLRPELIVDFGYTESGRLILKDSTKEVRKDLVSKVMKRDGVPVIVFRQGKYNIAFPVKLIKTNKGLENTVNEIINNSSTSASAAVEINKLLLENNLSPKNYNLYYTDANNQTIFDENGNYSENLQRAVADLALKEDFINPRDWQTREDVANSAVINVDLTNTPLVSPKPVLDLQNLSEITGDWYQEYKKTGIITDEKITEIANKIAYREVLTVQEYDLSDHPEVEKAVEEIYKLENSQEKEAKNNLDKPCKS